MEKIKLLLVDDDEILAFIFANALNNKEINCEFISKPTAESGLEYLQETSDFPDIIFIDYKLPGKDGFDFLLEYEKQRFHEREALVFMISSSSKQEMAKAVQAFSFVEAFIEKPFAPQKLRELIKYYFPKAVNV